MPKLHLIYDPYDRIQTSPEINQSTKVKVAVMNIEEDLNLAEIAYIGKELVRLLMTQLSPEARNEDDPIEERPA